MSRLYRKRMRLPSHHRTHPTIELRRKAKQSRVAGTKLPKPSPSAGHKSRAQNISLPPKRPQQTRDEPHKRNAKRSGLLCNVGTVRDKAQQVSRKKTRFNVHASLYSQQKLHSYLHNFFWLPSIPEKYNPATPCGLSEAFPNDSSRRRLQVPAAHYY